MCYLEEIPLKIKEAQNSTFDAAILKLYLAARAYLHVCDVISLTQNWQEAENEQQTSWHPHKLTKMYFSKRPFT